MQMVYSLVVTIDLGAVYRLWCVDVFYKSRGDQDAHPKL
jgi:hypothetical protein